MSHAVLELVGGGYVINGAYPVYFNIFSLTWPSGMDSLIVAMSVCCMYVVCPLPVNVILKL